MAVFLFAGIPWGNGHEAFAVVVKPQVTPWLRGTEEFQQLKVSDQARYVAFVPKEGLGLSILDAKSKEIFAVTKAQVGPSFFWSPDGARLFYRELRKDKAGAVASIIKVYDCVLQKNVELETLADSTGYLTFDPRDMKVHYLYNRGIRTKRISFPGERLAKWQLAQREDTGKWLVAQNGVLWSTHKGVAMRRLHDDGSKVESFSVSPDGKAIAWATDQGRVYTSTKGDPPRYIGEGRDPDWHPEKPFLIYSAARKVGNQRLGYDLRIVDQNGSSRFITSTEFSSERWPKWLPDGKHIIYTKEKTTDLYLMDFVP